MKLRHSKNQLYIGDPQFNLCVLSVVQCLTVCNFSNKILYSVRYLNFLVGPWLELLTRIVNMTDICLHVVDYIGAIWWVD